MYFVLFFPLVFNSFILKQVKTSATAIRQYTLILKIHCLKKQALSICSVAPHINISCFKYFQNCKSKPKHHKYEFFC